MGYERGLWNNDERRKTNGGNKISSDDGFTEARWRRHDSVFVFKHLVGGNLLFGMKGPFECHLNWIARATFV